MQVLDKKMRTRRNHLTHIKQTVGRAPSPLQLNTVATPFSSRLHRPAASDWPRCATDSHTMGCCGSKAGGGAGPARPPPRDLRRANKNNKKKSSAATATATGGATNNSVGTRKARARDYSPRRHQQDQAASPATPQRRAGVPVSPSPPSSVSRSDGSRRTASQQRKAHAPPPPPPPPAAASRQGQGGGTTTPRAPPSAGGASASTSASASPAPVIGSGSGRGAWTIMRTLQQLEGRDSAAVVKAREAWQNWTGVEYGQTLQQQQQQPQHSAVGALTDVMGLSSGAAGAVAAAAAAASTSRFLQAFGADRAVSVLVEYVCKTRNAHGAVKAAIVLVRALCCVVLCCVVLCCVVLWFVSSCVASPVPLCSGVGGGAALHAMLGHLLSPLG